MQRSIFNSYPDACNFKSTPCIFRVRGSTCKRINAVSGCVSAIPPYLPLRKGNEAKVGPFTWTGIVYLPLQMGSSWGEPRAVGVCGGQPVPRPVLVHPWKWGWRGWWLGEHPHTPREPQGIYPAGIHPRPSLPCMRPMQQTKPTNLAVWTIGRNSPGAIQTRETNSQEKPSLNCLTSD